MGLEDTEIRLEQMARMSVGWRSRSSGLNLGESFNVIAVASATSCAPSGRAENASHCRTFKASSAWSWWILQSMRS